MTTSIETQSIFLQINGSRKNLNIEPRFSILDALRDHLPLTGTKEDCDQSAGGVCQTGSMTQVGSNSPQLAELGRLLDAGTVRVAIDSTFPFADARWAHERAARWHIQGKIVLMVT
jgi:NADPH:quinone reductase-like Zn-dependent oxidoreductase